MTVTSPSARSWTSPAKGIPSKKPAPILLNRWNSSSKRPTGRKSFAAPPDSPTSPPPKRGILSRYERCTFQRKRRPDPLRRLGRAEAKRSANGCRRPDHRDRRPTRAVVRRDRGDPREGNPLQHGGLCHEGGRRSRPGHTPDDHEPARRQPVRRQPGGGRTWGDRPDPERAPRALRLHRVHPLLQQPDQLAYRRLLQRHRLPDPLHRSPHGPPRRDRGGRIRS